MNFRINYRQLLPITIGKGQKVYLQGSVVREKAITPRGFFNLPCGQRVQCIQVIPTQAELEG